MDFTPEQQAAINAEVAKQMQAMQAGMQQQTSMMQQQHANALELQVSSQNAAAALHTAQTLAQSELQTRQQASALEINSKQARLSAVQVAQSTLIANRNNKPVDEREISAADIVAYAESIVTYVNG
jgi:hypothetical protein